MSSVGRSREPLSIHDFLPRVSSFLMCISLKTGSIIISVFSIVYSIWHINLLNSRKYHDNKNTAIIKSFLKIIMMLSDATFGVLSVVLIYAIFKPQVANNKGYLMKEINLARLWLLAALQNGILLLIFEYFACPIHCKDPTSKEVFKLWPSTYLYCTLPFVILYCMYVVNSYIITFPKPRAYPTCEIPMTG